VESKRLFIDARNLDDGRDYEYELCIIGAGAAGITLARNFAGGGIKVCVLEGGGLEPDYASQALYDGELSGLPYHALDVCRLRYFGGTTNHWAGYCWPLQASTFIERPWIPYSGWPITQQDLAPYYNQAADLLGLPEKAWTPELGWDLAAWEREFEEHRVPFNQEYFFQHSILINPLRFGAVFKDDLGRAENVHVFLNANAVELETEEAGGFVQRCRVQTLNQRNLSFTARFFILAAGGIENARLLLLSNRAHGNGLGNQNDLVGRFFMDHVSVPIGRIQVAHPNVPLDLYVRYKDRPVLGELDHSVGISANDKMQEKFELVPVWVRMLPELENFWTSEGPVALKEVREDLAKGDIPDDLDEHIGRIFGDLGSIAELLHARVTYDGHTYESVNVRAGLAPAPNPESRVTLSDEMDALGLRKSRLDWHLSEIDYRSVVWIANRFAVEVGASGIGRMKITLGDETSWTEQLWGTRHHIGTTRMSDTAKSGVVDPDCRVHGIRNLYLSGSSVFPTCGSGSPTFAIIALAQRLADHLGKKLK